jgi:N-glycosylase/DNA lyase
MYKVSGMLRTGLDSKGEPRYDYYQEYYPYQRDLNDLVAQYDNFLAQIVAKNDAVDLQWITQNKPK